MKFQAHSSELRSQYPTLIYSWMYLVLRLSVALCEFSEGAEVPLETSQLGSRGRAGLSITAASPLPQTGPQGQQEVTDQELHPLGRKRRQR